MKKRIKISENELRNIVTECVKKVLREDSNYINYLIISGTDEALLARYDNSDEAIEAANNLAMKNRYGTYYVVKAMNYEYDLPEDIIYSTDDENM